MPRSPHHPKEKKRDLGDGVREFVIIFFDPLLVVVSETVDIIAIVMVMVMVMVVRASQPRCYNSSSGLLY